MAKQETDQIDSNGNQTKTRYLKQSHQMLETITPFRKKETDRATEHFYRVDEQLDNCKLSKSWTHNWNEIQDDVAIDQNAQAV